MNKRLTGIIVSMIMTVSLFMTQIFAAEGVSVSDDPAEDTGTQQLMAADGGDSVSQNESWPEENKEEDNGGDQSTDDPDAPVENKENDDTEAYGNDDPEQEENTGDTDDPGDPVRIIDEGDDPAINKDDHSEDIITEEIQEEAVSEVSEEEWLEEHGVKQNEDGSFDYTDENGDHWEFAPEDPEMYKRVSEPGAVASGPVIKLKSGAQWRRAALGEEQDPYTLILNPDFRYKYPSYFTVSGDEVLPDVRCGMDISRYQGEISPEDWRTLKDTYGIEFVFIRAGYRGYGEGGSLNEDVCCGANIENAYEAGVAVGIYYFSQAVSEREARDEADDCIDVIKDYKDMITLPVVIDYEYSGSPGRLRGAHLSDAEHTDVVNAFCDRVEEEGYIPGIYANRSMLQRDMNLEDIPEKNHIWMANFVGDDDDDGVFSTTYSGRLSSWQFSSRFTGFGEAEDGLNLMKSMYLDLDLWYGDFPGEEKAEFAKHSVSDNEFTEEDAAGPSEEAEADEREAADQDDEDGVVVVDVDSNDRQTLTSYDADGGNSDAMSISSATMTATDVYYSPRPRAYRPTVRVYGSDGSRLAAGFDYDRNLEYTYDQDTVISRRADMWGRELEEVTVSAGETVDMKKDIIPAGTVIRVTAIGKGRYEDPEVNTVSTTFKVLPEKPKRSDSDDVLADEGSVTGYRRYFKKWLTQDKGA